MTTLNIEYGTEQIQVQIPVKADIEGIAPVTMVSSPQNIIKEAFLSPIASKPIYDIARQKKLQKPDIKAVITVSDNTRPTPYKGKNGILLPVLNELVRAGISQNEILILIGTGSHRDMHESEIEQMLGLKEMGVSDIAVRNHHYEDESELVFLGETKRGTRVKINRFWVEADLKIVTGLIESHFMAGASGGPKGICPALVSKETLQRFHGADLLSAESAADMILTNNPIQQELTEIALMAGADFLVNATLDHHKRLTGVFCGDLLEAHRAGVEYIRNYVMIPLKTLYDLVIIPAGFVGINHYQAAKAGVIASKAVKPGGKIIIVAKNTDPEPIGGQNYKLALQYLKESGYEKFLTRIQSPEWQFIPEQWQVQLWCRVIEKTRTPENIIYCSREIPESQFIDLPCVSGRAVSGSPEITEMIEKSVMKILTDYRKERTEPCVLYLTDGPYGVPYLSK